MEIAVVLAVAAAVLFVVGLISRALRWMVILAVVLLVAAFYTGYIS